MSENTDGGPMSEEKMKHRNRRLMRVDEVAELFDVAKPTIYEHARNDPEKWGVVRVGRAMRFRRDVIEAMIDKGDR